MLIGRVGHLRDAALDFSGFATPEEVIAREVVSFMGFLGHDLTPAEAEEFAETTCTTLEHSGWCLSALLNREIFALPAAELEAFIRASVGFDRD